MCHWLRAIVSICLSFVFYCPMGCCDAAGREAPKEQTGNREDRRFIGAAVKFVMDEHGEFVDRTIHVDMRGAQELASFFPELGQGRRSPEAGGWISNVEVTFRRPDGTSVHVGSDFDVWTEDNNNGDFPVRGDFRTYARQLFTRPSTAPVSQP